METKNITIGKIKAAGDAGLKDGEMIAYASVNGNTDSYGDRVAKGAFANTLKAWFPNGKAAEGRKLPLLYGHNMTDPNMNIGEVYKAEEDDRGLKIWARFDDDEQAQKVYRLVKAGRIAELSFAYDVIKSAQIEDPNDPKAFRELQELKLYECSVVPIGANSETEVLAIKSNAEALVAGAKAGRTLSKANEAKIRDAITGLDSAKELLEGLLPDSDPEDDAPSEGDDQDESAKSGVSSEAHAAPSNDGAPGTEEIKALIREVLAESPSDDPEPSESDALVAEIEFLGL